MFPGVEKLTGAGVYYGAAATEALSCQNEDAYIVGAGNSAGQAAMYLSRFAKTVTLIVRGDSLTKTMSQYLDRSNWENAEYLRAVSLGSDRGKRQRQARRTHHRQQSDGRNKNSPGNCAFHFHWCNAAYERDC